MKSQCSSSSFLELPSYTSFEGEDGDEDEEMEEVTTLSWLFLKEKCGQIYLQFIAGDYLSCGRCPFDPTNLESRSKLANSLKQRLSCGRARMPSNL